MKVKRFAMLLLALCLCLGLMAVTAFAAQGDVEINEKNFPDVNFRDYIITNCDSDDNGLLSAAEIEVVTGILISEYGISSLQGVEYFTALELLYCHGNQLSSLDMSKNTALRSLDCANNELTSLNVSGCTELAALYCDRNQLTDLDVTKNTALGVLNCSYNQLTTLDVSKNSELWDFSCYYNQLTSLDVSKNTQLWFCYCYNNRLTSLDVRGCTELWQLYCENNLLTSLDVSSNTTLEELRCYYNQLTSLDVSKNTELTNLDCSSNRLTSLDVSKNAAFESLHCHSNQLTSLDVSKNPVLVGLFCSSNRLTSLDVSKNAALESLYCHNNQLTSLDVSKNTALEELSCYNNQLTSLDVSSNTQLLDLYCFGHNYTINVNAERKYDLTQLPEGFNMNKASNWIGGSVNGMILTVDASAETVTYSYDCGNEMVRTFTLLINEEEPLEISTQPVTQKVKTGSKAVFAVEATGAGLTYQWQHKTSSSGTWKNATAEGNQTATLRVPATTERSGNYYRCVIKDSAGNEITTNTVMLYVLGIKTQPTTQKVKAGTTAKFTVSATGSNKTYQWQYKTSANGEWKNCTAEGNKSATLKVEATTGKSSYYYRCVIKDSAGNEITTNTVRLYVLGVTSQPTTQKVKAGTIAKFTVSATGSNKTYQWQYKTSANGEWKNCTAEGNKTATLKVSATTSKSSYYYLCVIKDSAGNEVTTNVVRLYVLGIKTQPVSQTVAKGITVKFTVSATGLNKTYQWQYRTSPNGAWKNATASGNKTATLTLTATATRNGYQYRCMVKDSGGNTVYSNAATLKLK